MAITIKDIAALAGVSRGTVDRVLHNRGRVNPEVKNRILAIAQKLAYKPSRAAKQLVLQKRKLKLGIICRTDIQGFWPEVLKGVDAITNELAEYGVKVLRRFFPNFYPEEQLALIDELCREGISGLVIVPLNDPVIRDKLQSLKAAGITVVVVNSGIDGFEPLCYIGNDYYKSGRTAAGLFHLFGRGVNQRLVVLRGSHNMMSHQQRLDGFMGELQTLGTPFTLIGGFEITRDLAFAYERTLEVLKQYPDTDAIFSPSGSLDAVNKAIKNLGLVGRIIYICFDLTSNIKPALHDGSITAVIGQEAFRQGYLSLKILFDYLVCGIEPGERHILTHNEIFIRQNCEERP